MMMMTTMMMMNPAELTSLMVFTSHETLLLLPTYLVGWQHLVGQGARKV